jgi:hypothetical protein
MPTAGQCIGQPVHKDTIPPKIVWGIEGGNHTEAEWSSYHRDPD